MAKPYKLHLQALLCNTTEDSSGPDEAYLLVNGVQIWGPTSINDHQHRDVNKTIAVAGGTSTIMLWDADSPDADDNLGTVTVDETQINTGMRSGKFNEDDASYTLWYWVDAA